MTMKTNMSVHDKLVHILTQYDISQSTKPGYNRYALGQYLQALAEAEEASLPIAEALAEIFRGRLLVLLLKGIP